MMKLQMFGTGKGKAVQNKELDDFINTLLKLNSKEKTRDFLEGILTPKELVEIPNRLAIVKMLKRGISQHDVAGELGVGIATVSRGSRELQKGRFQYI